MYAPTIAKLKRDFEFLHKIVDDCDAGVILTSREYGQFVNSESFVTAIKDCNLHWPNVSWIVSDELPIPAEERSYPVTASDVAFIQYTSGSTSQPKGVTNLHHQLLHNLAFQAKALHMREESVEVIWVPHYHDMGLILSLLLAVHVGYRAYLMSPFTFVREPGLWLEIMSDVRATVSKAPNFAYELVMRKPPKKAIDLSCVETMVNASEPVLPSTLNKFFEMFSLSGLSVAPIPVYGLAEHTVIATVLGPPHSQIVRRGLPSHGFPPDDIVLKIVDPNTLRECCGGEVGEIWLDSPSKSCGYWEQPIETEKTFQARMDGDDSRRYLRTGDLGFIEDSQLFIAGRIKDVIIINGQTVFPQDVELTIQQATPLIRPGCIAVFDLHPMADDSEIVVVAEVHCPEDIDSPAELCQQVAKAVALEHEIALSAVCLVKPRTIPKTTSGKIQRGESRRLYSSHKLEWVYHLVAALYDSNPGVSPSVDGSQSGVADSLTTPDGSSSPSLVAMQARQFLIDDVVKAIRYSLSKETKNSVTPNSHILSVGMQSLEIMQLRGHIKEVHGIEMSFNKLLCLGSPVCIAEDLDWKLNCTGTIDGRLVLKNQQCDTNPSSSDPTATSKMT